MNNLRNSVRLIGNLGVDPEVKEFEQGRKLARFSIATNENYKDSKGNKVTETSWHQLIAWGRNAEIAEKYLHKGSEVAVEGKLITRNYIDNKTGGKRCQEGGQCLPGTGGGSNECMLCRPDGLPGPDLHICGC